MYIARHFAMPDDLVRRILADPGAGDLVTARADGLVATHLPYLWRPSGDDPRAGSLILHVARNNTQWSTPCVGEALFVINRASDYISSRWYPSARENDKLVPTWDYATVHLYGKLVAHDDLAWTTAAVADLLARHESGLTLNDMPERYVAGELRAIVGLELQVTRIEAKAKLSQNRTPEDVTGVIEGLRAAEAHETADLVEEYAKPHAERRAALVADVAERHRPNR